MNFGHDPELDAGALNTESTWNCSWTHLKLYLFFPWWQFNSIQAIPKYITHKKQIICIHYIYIYIYTLIDFCFCFWLSWGKIHSDQASHACCQNENPEWLLSLTQTWTACFTWWFYELLDSFLCPEVFFRILRKKECRTRTQRRITRSEIEVSSSLRATDWER